MLFKDYKHVLTFYIIGSMALLIVTGFSIGYTVIGDYYSGWGAVGAFLWYGAMIVIGLIGISVCADRWDDSDWYDRHENEKIPALIFLSIVLVSSVVIPPWTQTVECNKQSVEKLKLNENMRNDSFNDGTYYEVTCDKDVFYIDDDINLHTDNVYSKADMTFTSNPGIKEATNYDIINDTH